MRREKLKDHFSETRLFTSRAIFSLFFILTLLALLVTRLVFLQIIDNEHYTTLSNDNRLKLLPIGPSRGLIYDRNGIVLAENLAAYRLEIIPEQVDDMDALLLQLDTLINIRKQDLKQFKKLLKHRQGFDNIPLRFRLNDTEVAKISAIQHRLPGVHIAASLNRHYPLADTFAHVLGYVGRKDVNDLKRLDPTNYISTSHIGKTGIEKQYEAELHGYVGYQQVETNAQGRLIRVLEQTPPVSGKDIHLTIDATLQAIAKSALGKHNGSIVAIDPRNGEVLSMISNPGFDPNLFVNGIGYKAYKALRKNDSQPLYNRSLLGRYPPGSTIKPFMGLAGLKYGITNPHHEVFCPGYFIIPFGENRKFRDWKKTGHGSVNLDDSITQSCDVYFYELALNLSIDRINPFLKTFGFGSKTGIDMPSENSGLLPSRAWKRKYRRQPWFPGETLNTGIGQGFLLTTPLQLATATAIFANKGRPVKPHLVINKNESYNKSDIDPLLAQVQPHHWNYMFKAMKHVIHSARGTARRIASKNYIMAGKTGTSQVFGIKQEEEYDEEKVAFKLRDHALFIAFAPIKNPRIAVAVIAENGGSGGKVAAPIAAKIINYYMAKNP
ncbi:MAG: penicillin-binding protein 2 [Gammaproteobacteria bacterium]|nr:penicillin-binding protein 2 [Gammaproteobacteria bacterium]